MPILDQDGAVTRPPIRVCVAIPSGDDVKAGFAYDLAQMVGATVAARPDIDIRLSNVQGTIIHKSRRDLVLLALKGDCTHILFLDSDMRFPRNTLARLLSHGEPIVGCNYSTRRAPCKPVTFASDTDATLRVFTELGQDGLQEVSSTGMGVMLIDLDVFRHLAQPWFDFEWDPKDGHMTGEDVFFCRKVRDDLGLTIQIDHGLSHDVAHIGTYEYTLGDALVARELAAGSGN